jgi:hypothetical protein
MPDRYKPPGSVASNAKRGLELRKKWGRGGTEVGVARARQLSRGTAISRETVAKMSGFNRHRKSGENTEKKPDGGPSAGRIAWLLWGGSTGVNWARKIMGKK